MERGGERHTSPAKNPTFVNSVSVKPVQHSAEHRPDDAEADISQGLTEPQPSPRAEQLSEFSRLRASSTVAAQCGSSRSTQASHGERSATSEIDQMQGSKDPKDSKDLKEQRASDKSSYREIMEELVKQAGSHLHNQNKEPSQDEFDISFERLTKVSREHNSSN
ncbi:hypothetical protein Landi51_11388 [Colletotrichum acutatum]